MVECVLCRGGVLVNWWSGMRIVELILCCSGVDGAGCLRCDRLESIPCDMMQHAGCDVCVVM